MSHEVETMMYAGETPWHGLGEYVGDVAVDSRTALIKAGLDWKVGKFPLFAEIEHQRTKEIRRATTDEYYAIIRNRDCKMLGVVQGRYQVYQNEDCFEFMDTVAGPTGDVGYHTAGSLRGGKVVWILAKLKDMYIEPIKGDVTENFLLLSTSHDGTASLHVMFTPVRVVCANTLAMATGGKGKAGIKIRHTGDLKDKTQRAQEILGLVVDEHNKYKEVCEYLAKLQVNTEAVDAFIDKMLPLPEGRRPTRTINAREKVLELFESGKGTEIPGVRGTGWGLYNAWTEYLNWHKTYRETKTNSAGDNKLHSLWYGQSADEGKKAQELLLENA